MHIRQRLALACWCALVPASDLTAQSESPDPGPRSSFAQAGPEPRAHHQVVYHAGEARVYLVGGSTRRGDGYHYFDDIWAWNGRDWVEVSSLPFPRSSHRVVHHSARNSLILFGGGFATAVRAEGVLWEWRNGQWKAIGGNFQAGLSEPGMCYDRRRERVVIFGGWDASATYRGETWEWAGAGEDLAQVDSTGPRPRAGHAFLYDLSRQRCLLVGGRDAEGYLDDMWEWDGRSWHRLEARAPSARWFFGSAIDERRGHIVIFGGAGPDALRRGRDGTGDFGDTWAWDGEHWKQLSSEGPSARGMAKLAFTGSGIVLFGGRMQTTEGFQDQHDTWELLGSTWVRRR
ncbi:MAG TPA: kelch repeat-containing protein [Longimicrobiales bacterium]|nr:kelch repeat-containing protein [Longimicrobiales bacterium]